MKSLKKMAPVHGRVRTLIVAGADSDNQPIVPVVDYIEPPRIRIYDGANDGSYWFRGIGFLSTFSEP